MILKFPGKCSRCGVEIPKGTEANYDAKTRTVNHFDWRCEDASSLPYVEYDGTPEGLAQATKGETAKELARRLGFRDAADRVD